MRPIPPAAAPAAACTKPEPELAASELAALLEQLNNAAGPAKTFGGAASALQNGTTTTTRDCRVSRARLPVVSSSKSDAGDGASITGGRLRRQRSASLPDISTGEIRPAPAMLSARSQRERIECRLAIKGREPPRAATRREAFGERPSQKLSLSLPLPSAPTSRKWAPRQGCPPRLSATVPIAQSESDKAATAAASKAASKAAKRASKKKPTKKKGNKKKGNKKKGGQSSRCDETVLPCGLTQRELNEMMSRELTPEDYEVLLKLDEQVAKPESRLCTSAQVDRFPLLVIGEPEDGEEPRECGACLCPIEPGEEARRLPCCRAPRGFFHDDCIRKWLCETKNSCPACLHEFPRED